MGNKELGEMLMADETFLGISELKFGYSKIICNVHRVSLTDGKYWRNYNETLLSC